MSVQKPCTLEELQFATPQTVVVLAPHPDDFDAIAVSLRRLQSCGHAIHVAVLTTGANGIEDGWNGITDRQAKAQVREAEQRSSCAHFGLPEERLQFLHLWENEDDPDRDAVDLDRLQTYLLQRRPDLVFLPHCNDSNRTHRRTYERFVTIAHMHRLQVLAFLAQDAKTLEMRIDLHTDFDEEEAAWKAELLRLHRSQQERNLKTRGHGFDQRVLAVNRAAAQAMGSALPYAEVFELRRFD
ncbi:PIG-L deacetylase family protein [Noviherbaspirillum pedocola]|uniref:PIG-L family deacetylase n=1 Tax=Noviherbaspirillum pedocola TaxID=2801341 RepID=A0A934T220_9BURK|nr:PIG-L family deacetylase [Noviherbaspirillum pedocola]MBK4736313.1 PIG-L family deacetylase [Noviherbaspirillum pedocola]